MLLSKILSSKLKRRLKQKKLNVQLENEKRLRAEELAKFRSEASKELKEVRKMNVLFKESCDKELETFKFSLRNELEKFKRNAAIEFADFKAACNIELITLTLSLKAEEEKNELLEKQLAQLEVILNENKNKIDCVVSSHLYDEEEEDEIDGPHQIDAQSVVAEPLVGQKTEVEAVQESVFEHIENVEVQVELYVQPLASQQNKVEI